MNRRRPDEWDSLRDVISKGFADLSAKLTTVGFRLNGITARLDSLDAKAATLMSGLTDLQGSEAQETADINTLVSVVSTLITDLQAALANVDSDAAVEAASQIVAQQDAQLQQITAQLQGADPGSQTPPAPPAS